LRTKEQPHGTCDLQFFRDEYEKAKGSAADEVAFRTWYLTQFVGSPDAWIGSIEWGKCAEKFDEEELYGMPAVAGLDLSMRGDLCAYTLIVKKDDLFYLLPRFFSPEMLAKHKQKTDKIPLITWAANPKYNIHLTEGDVVDPEAIKRQIMADREHWGNFPVRFDEWGAELFRQDMEAEGVEMIPVSNNINIMAPPTGFFERLVRDQQIRHPGNPCLDWCLANCVPRIDAHERITLDKAKARGRIDGVVASIIALTGYMADEEEDSWSGSIL
jgi:phage terminase large subunit-like protein